MTGPTPIGDAAREATASPYVGRHRADTWWPEPAERVGRCPSCGHWCDLCGCTCCDGYGDDDGI